MGAYLRPSVSCRLIPTIISRRKKDNGESRKIEKFSQKLCTTLCVCVCMCVCVCVRARVCVCVCV